MIERLPACHCEDGCHCLRCIQVNHYICVESCGCKEDIRRSHIDVLSFFLRHPVVLCRTTVGEEHAHAHNIRLYPQICASVSAYGVQADSVECCSPGNGVIDSSISCAVDSY